MKRALVFLLLAPTLVAFVAWSNIAPVNKGLFAGLRELVTVVLFIFSLLVSAITAPIDGRLAHTVPLSLRAPLTSIIGAAIAVALLVASVRLTFPSWTMLPQCIWMPFAVGGALCMGTCSLLSHDYRSHIARRRAAL